MGSQKLGFRGKPLVRPQRRPSGHRVGKLAARGRAKIILAGMGWARWEAGAYATPDTSRRKPAGKRCVRRDG